MVKQWNFYRFERSEPHSIPKITTAVLGWCVRDLFLLRKDDTPFDYLQYRSKSTVPPGGQKMKKMALSVRKT